MPIVTLYFSSIAAIWASSSGRSGAGASSGGATSGLCSTLGGVLDAEASGAFAGDRMQIAVAQVGLIQTDFA